MSSSSWSCDHSSPLVQIKASVQKVGAGKELLDVQHIIFTHSLLKCPVAAEQHLQSLTLWLRSRIGACKFMGI